MVDHNIDELAADARLELRQRLAAVPPDIRLVRRASALGRELLAVAAVLVVVGVVAGLTVRGDTGDGVVVAGQGDGEGQRATAGTIEISLVDYPGYIEGFNYGVRLEVDGAVVAERLLRDFDRGTYQRYQDQTWRTEFDVPVGEVEVVSHLVISNGTEPPAPDFSTPRNRPAPVDGFQDPCRTKVDVRSRGISRLRLNWATGCLSEVF